MRPGIIATVCAAAFAIMCTLGCQTADQPERSEDGAAQKSAPAVSETVATDTAMEEAPVSEPAEEAEPFPHALFIPLGSLVLRIDGMYGAPKLNRDSVAQLDTLRFELSMGAMDGNISDVKLVVDSGAIDAVSIEERYCSTLMFNEDGSGGVWTIDSIPEHCTDWIKLERSSDSTFTTLSTSESSDAYPHSTAADSAIAKSFVSGREWPTAFFESCSRAAFRVTVDSETKMLLFDIHPGD